MSGLDVIHTLTWVIAALAVLLALWRVAVGPTLLDRVVANDVLTAAAIGIVAVMIVSWARPDLMAVMLVLVVTSFLTAVVVSRFALGEQARERRILSKRQAARQLQEREEAARLAERWEAQQAIAQAEAQEAKDDGAEADALDALNEDASKAGDRL